MGRGATEGLRCAPSRSGRAWRRPLKVTPDSSTVQEPEKCRVQQLNGRVRADQRESRDRHGSGGRHRCRHRPAPPGTRRSRRSADRPRRRSPGGDGQAAGRIARRAGRGSGGQCRVDGGSGADRRCGRGAVRTGRPVLRERRCRRWRGARRERGGVEPVARRQCDGARACREAAGATLGRARRPATSSVRPRPPGCSHRSAPRRTPSASTARWRSPSGSR